MRSCNRGEEEVCTKKEEGIPAVEKIKRGSKRVC